MTNVCFTNAPYLLFVLVLVLIVEHFPCSDCEDDFCFQLSTINSQPSTNQRPIPVFPHRLVTQLAKSRRPLQRPAIRRGCEMPRCVPRPAHGCPFAGPQFHNPAALSVMQLF